jgi:hypothetical protein
VTLKFDIPHLIISRIRDLVRSLAASEPHDSLIFSIGTELKTIEVITLKHFKKIELVNNIIIDPSQNE